MTTEEPFITVIITAYNRKKYIIEAIKSILSCSLSREHYEIIIIINYNDNEINSFSKLNNIKIIVMDGSIGHFYLEALELSRGDVIAFLDDDDIWTNDKLKKIYEVFKNNVNLGYYHNEYAYINEKGEPMNYRRVIEQKKIDTSSSGFLYITKYSRKKSLRNIFRLEADFNMSSICIRKDIFVGRDYQLLDRIYGFIDGVFLFISLLSDYDIIIDNEILTLYRINKDSTTSFNQITKRIMELEKMGSSMIALRDYIENVKNIEIKNILDALNCFIYENLIMIEIFSLSNRRKKVFTNLISLIKIKKSNSNMLKNKIVLMAIASIFSQKLAVNLYGRYKKYIISSSQWHN